MAKTTWRARRVRGSPGRLVVGGDEGEAADLQQVGGGEEGHAHREVRDRVHECALLDNQGQKAGFARGNGHGESGGAGADDEHVRRVFGGWSHARSIL